MPLIVRTLPLGVRKRNYKQWQIRHMSNFVMKILPHRNILVLTFLITCFWWHNPSVIISSLILVFLLPLIKSLKAVRIIYSVLQKMLWHCHDFSQEWGTVKTCRSEQAQSVCFVVSQSAPGRGLKRGSCLLKTSPRMPFSEVWSLDWAEFLVWKHVLYHSTVPQETLQAEQPVTSWNILQIIRDAAMKGKTVRKVNQRQFQHSVWQRDAWIRPQWLVYFPQKALCTGYFYYCFSNNENNPKNRRRCKSQNPWGFLGVDEKSVQTFGGLHLCVLHITWRS